MQILRQTLKSDFAARFSNFVVRITLALKAQHLKDVLALTY